jgi:outer membrane lipoprotein-sorting protein
VKNNLVRLTLVSLMLSLLFGCVPSKPVREIKEIPPSRVIKKVEANRRKISTFRATGIINVSSSTISAKANFEVMIKKPDSLKLSVYGPFGIELAQAVVTPTEYQFYDPIHSTLYRGSNKEGIIEKILKVDLSFDDLMDALSGSVNLSNNLRENPDKFDITDDSYILTYINEKNKQSGTYVIDNNSLALLSYKILSANNDPILVGEYRNFKMLNEVPVPYNSKITYAGKNQSLDIEYRSVEINNDISDLTLHLPSDVQVVEW